MIFSRNWFHHKGLSSSGKGPHGEKKARGHSFLKRLLDGPVVGEERRPAKTIHPAAAPARIALWAGLLGMSFGVALDHTFWVAGGGFLVFLGIVFWWHFKGHEHFRQMLERKKMLKKGRVSALRQMEGKRSSAQKRG